MFKIYQVLCNLVIIAYVQRHNTGRISLKTHSFVVFNTTAMAIKP
jgi:hypothetical protein